tara:strand:+ start:147 stop:362 length:216 start_codon:yes stop_codon:yes gene_type:complete
MKIDQRFTVGVILGLVLIVILACSNTATSNVIDYDTTIKTVDSCEYVIASQNWDNIAMVHHANCHNPIHNK